MVSAWPVGAGGYMTLSMIWANKTGHGGSLFKIRISFPLLFQFIAPNVSYDQQEKSSYSSVRKKVIKQKVPQGQKVLRRLH